MKILVTVLIAFYSLFVFIVGDTAQKGMLLSELVLTGLIALFYKYSTLARTIMGRYEELKKAVFTADGITHFIDDLEIQKDALRIKIWIRGLRWLIPSEYSKGQNSSQVFPRMSTRKK